MGYDRPIDRRRFLKGTGAALAFGTGASIASESAAAAVTDKHYQIEITPLDSETYFVLEVDSDTDPEVALEPLDGYCFTSGSTVYGSIENEVGTAVIGVDTYAPSSIDVDDGPLAFGAEFIEDNFNPSLGAPEDDPDRFCQIEVSGDGKYVIGTPFVSGIDTARSSRYGDAWGADDSLEVGPSSFVGMDAGRRSVTFKFASQDNILAIEYNGEDEPVYNQFVPSSDDLSDRSDKHDGVGVLGAVKGGTDKYQTAGFQKDPAGFWESMDLYDPIPYYPSWMRLGSGVDVEVFTTDTDRGCPWV